MKAKLLAALLALALIGSALYYNQSQTPAAITVTGAAQSEKILAPLPNITFTSSDGHLFDISAIHQPTILIHFWAAWCAPCSAEFPDLLRYIASSHSKIALIAVSLDDNYAASAKALGAIAVKSHVDLHDANLYWAWDRDKSLSLKMFNTVKVPETIIVNAQRQMADKIIGPGPWKEASTHP